jgi:hypothetical protein
MKKAKILLVAITVFAVAGGALAFKVKTQDIYCGVQGARAGSLECPILENSNYVTTTAPDTYCTKVFNEFCVDPVKESEIFPDN